MSQFVSSPVQVFIVSLVALWIAAQLGDLTRRKIRPLSEEERPDFNTVLAATLTLLGLIIGFTFSMAISRYDQRKNYEEAEANAIGTEYLRADLLRPDDRDKVRNLLKAYLDLRVRFYSARQDAGLAAINRDTARVQDQLWSAVRDPATTQPTAVTALVASGMNDVLNSQGYTQAAWWNRIPAAAWALMAAIAICCNLLIGYSAHRFEIFLLVILPLAVSISFFLISDIDSPRGGVIRVQPQNLISLQSRL